MPFIESVMSDFANQNDVIFDIFSGSGSVSSELNTKYEMIANDAESYASIIADAALNTPNEEVVDSIINTANIWLKEINEKSTTPAVLDEEKFIQNDDYSSLNTMYSNLPTVWNEKFNVIQLREAQAYNLFQTYYGGSYFGIRQAFDIDELIRKIHSVEKYRNIYMSALFYAMKEAVFSKDGHMAQPLSGPKYPGRMLKSRSVSILDKFAEKILDYAQYSVLHHVKGSTVLNLDFKKALDNSIVQKKSKVIYADPPYTDMQYSRYYHLLNVAAEYIYPDLTMNNGKYTKGLYTSGRNQSILSQKGKAKDGLTYLISRTKSMGKTIVISYAYPENKELQNVDRYTVSINQLIQMVKNEYGTDKTYIYKKKYEHANNRNANKKKVYEYLIVGGDKINET